MADIHVLVTIWEFNTELTESRLPDDYRFSAFAQNRLMCIAAMLEQANAHWSTHQQRINSNPFNPHDFKALPLSPDYQLCVAPEYLFAKSGVHPFLSEEEKETIRATSSWIAKSHPSAILIPGTTLWKKSMIRPDSRVNQRGTQQPKAGAKTRDFSKYQGVNARTFEPIKRELYARDMATGRNQRDATLQDWTQNPANGQQHIARNSAFICWGQNVKTQHKRYENVNYGDGKLLELAPDVDWTNIVFMPGEKPPLTTVHNMNIGLEICAEHALSTLGYLDMSDNHFQVITSASVTVDQKMGVAVKAGGFIVHADSREAAVYYVNSEINCIRRQEDFSFAVMELGRQAGIARSYLCTVDV